jgi:hypothetical protein
LFNNASAKNTIFFLPDGNVKNEPTDLVVFETEKNLFEDSEKAIHKDNTRLPQGFVEKMIDKASHNIKKAFNDNTENSNDVMALLSKAKEKRINENLSNTNAPPTPVVNGYKIIKDPEPIPGQIDPVPIMVWGEIASTPQILKSEKRFTVPSTPTREYIAHNLSNISQAKKIKELNDVKNKKTQQTFVKSNLNTYELTPKAMKLLSSVRRNHTNIFETPRIERNSGKNNSIESNFLNKKRISTVVVLKNKNESTPDLINKNK